MAADADTLGSASLPVPEFSDVLMQEDVSSDESDSELSGDEDGASVSSTFAPGATLLIFDWDDTILPLSWIQSQGLRIDKGCILTAAQRTELQSLASYAAQTLRIAKRLGRVVIVTNAERGWIELSCKKFMPSILPLIENVKLFSARSAYEKVGVTSPLVWKSLAFESELKAFYEFSAVDRPENILSIGDSAHERQALMQVTKSRSNCFNKSAKFMERPDVVQLRNEHEMFSQCLPHIVNHLGNLDLQVQLSS